MELTPEQVEAILKAATSGNPAARYWPYLMGLVLDGILQGILFCQAATWFRKSYPKERWILRTLAIWTLVVCLAFTCLQTARCLQIFAFDFGKYSGFLANAMAQWLIVMLFMVNIPVQGFFTHRAYVLANRSIVLLIALVIMIAAVTALAITCVAMFPAMHQVIVWPKVELDLFTAVSSMSAGLDVAITGCILIQLWRRRVGTGPSSRFIRRLMILSVESQFPPCIFAIVICVMDATGNIGSTPVMVALLTKSSAMNLFTVLNARRTLRSELNPTTIDLEVSFPLRVGS
ncbi:hypothetical protein DB88DRAFT_485637 [Papiliotrema laurentii]|uniref:DUF6534 domain-containing protein n=1 Tax=Papiliotrema laurentii TaxID=5418 RepID=A0AAD9L772_PAPLA|nr:hypothetical protein DB88DRAFT_485637 [Papiliotrema laurentii]